MFRHILLPTDGSELATKAVDAGIELAGALGAKVTILTVVEHFRVLTANPAQIEEARATYDKHAAAHASKLLAEAAAKAKAAGVEVATRTAVAETAWEAVTAAADELGVDLIAMASHGRRGLSALMLGSQTSRVLAQSKVPVLVYR